MPTNPHETGNLRKVLTAKINARVMITTHIDVADGLAIGAVGAVTNVVTEQTTRKMSVILVAFDSEHVGQETRYTCVYNSISQNAVQMHQTQATFAAIIKHHKCQGLTLSEIVIDMTHAKGKFRPGEAYVAFSRVRTLQKLHIINYTQSQIHVSEHVEKEMKRLRKISWYKCHPIS